MRKIHLLLVLIGCNIVIYAADIAVNGDVGFDFLYLKENKSNIDNNQNCDDFVSNVNADSFITYVTEDLYSITCDINVVGSLKPENNGLETKIAPLKLDISQLYINFILDDFIFYIGKKKREIGGNSYFNVSNRISPEFTNLGNSDNSSLGMIEVEWLLKDELQLGLISYFTNDNNWENINIAPYFYLTLWPVTLESYFYFEELKKIYISYNIETQLNDFGFYIEGILKEKSDLTIANNTKFLNWTNSLITGISYNNTLFSAYIEYLYNNEGWSSEDFYNYYQFTNSDNPNLKNYIVLGFNKNDLFIDNLSLRVNAVNSLSDSFKKLDKSSCRASASLTYMFNDLSFTGYFQRSFGGLKSEFIRIDRNEFLIGFFTTFYY